ncbi:MAG TPA: GNAT family N-acetyltransferase [Candidatus Nanopelagicaceae bacterium]|nr:GNAT family N-acetyltransferase [Candidatus Nanopelagicaceae bacterium]
MAGLTGQDVTAKRLETTRGDFLLITITRPTPNATNRKALRDASQMWTRQARQVAYNNPDAARHAYFASDVAFLAAQGLGEPNTVTLVAQDKDGVVHGVNITNWLASRQVWELGFQTTRPHDQPGYPARAQVRGVGTLLLQADASIMAAEHCTTVELETLDEEAARFWRRRGFEGTTEPLKMQCPRLRELAADLKNTPHDDAQAGEWVFAGKKKELAAVHAADAPD